MRSRAATFVLIPLSMLAASNVNPEIAKTRSWVDQWLRILPDFVCSQSVDSFWAYSKHSTWRRDHNYMAEVTVISGIEQYTLLAVDGHPDEGRSAYRNLLSSRGEFVSAVRLTFEAQSKAEFQYRGLHRRLDRELCLLQFKIRKENSQWFVGPELQYAPAYNGELWVDPVSGSIAELSMEATTFPSELALTSASLHLTFADVDIDHTAYVMPTSAEVNVCTRNYCERRSISFSDYHRFTAHSRVVAR